MYICQRKTPESHLPDQLPREDAFCSRLRRFSVGVARLQVVRLYVYALEMRNV